MYDTGSSTTYTVKVDALVASRFDSALKLLHAQGVVTAWNDDREPPLSNNATIEAAVNALIKDGRIIIAVKLVREYTEYRTLAQAKEAVFYYKHRHVAIEQPY